jgi:hypothetical protein
MMINCIMIVGFFKKNVQFSRKTTRFQKNHSINRVFKPNFRF